MQRHLPFLRPAAVLVTALGASVAIAACGGSSSSGSTGTSAASAANTGLKFASCVRAHGVPDYPDPRGGKVTVDIHSLSESAQVVTKATTACQRFSPGSSLGPRVTDAQLAKVQRGALAYSKCVRAHGVDIGDTEVSRGPNGQGLEIGWSPKELKEHPVPYKTPLWHKVNSECGNVLDSTLPASLQKKS
jgi:hypothetical protein